jgi:hypothetical protein
MPFSFKSRGTVIVADKEVLYHLTDNVKDTPRCSRYAKCRAPVISAQRKKMHGTRKITELSCLPNHRILLFSNDRHCFLDLQTAD